MSDELDDLLPKCRKCGQPAILYMTKVDSDAGEVESFHLCEEHAREYFPDENLNPPGEPPS